MQKNRPTDPETYQDLGQQLHRQGYLKESINCYQKGIELRGEPIHLWFYRNLGEALISYQSSVISEGGLWDNFFLLPLNNLTLDNRQNRDDRI
ncbi:hypothetical protein [Planktothrix agardhii]|uniref:Tetratricopeptide repeat protein n=1 Tax=Planktothrix agardhii (strain NIVA-CYA 126/8) TaxID=388467 RepID=A0A073CES0_PLAA1|nr:hypothetical protein [Planktothrix agardhii]KEI66382.1 hypothetical protein A19Y_1311 [Planktothrix agardhii NIVA-CYA 126/8]MCB8763394.1 hypothetical protein [Planktothrix agardhii 1809]MCB8777044.1 hypothetical protein [Planktothrix agardhii 1031]MCB8781474.1 hypothetical protein [Planktothrix agardhii 1808]MCF3567340.1 hypothetical protein [Planktothrix agardhii 1807]